MHPAWVRLVKSCKADQRILLDDDKSCHRYQGTNGTERVYQLGKKVSTGPPAKVRNAFDHKQKRLHRLRRKQINIRNSKALVPQVLQCNDAWLLPGNYGTRATYAVWYRLDQGATPLTPGRFTWPSA